MNRLTGRICTKSNTQVINNDTFIKNKGSRGRGETAADHLTEHHFVCVSEINLVAESIFMNLKCVVFAFS